MGTKRRILRSPKFKHLKKARFGSKASPEEQNNSEEQEKFEKQEPIVETPILKMVEEPPLAEEAKPTPVLKPKKATLKKATARKTTKKPTTAKKRTTKKKVK
tara:strand:+ start:1682 stop:1987 length:306 start_codon:yes stop_codon:yes gene_type:complete